MLCRGSWLGLTVEKLASVVGGRVRLPRDFVPSARFERQEQALLRALNAFRVFVGFGAENEFALVTDAKLNLSHIVVWVEWLKGGRGGGKIE